MSTKMKFAAATVALTAGVASLSGCDDATIAKNNIRKAADNFEINRRIVFYNGITNSYMLSIEGMCSVESTADKLAVICKTPQGEFLEHKLGKSDNVTWFAEQLEAAKVSSNNYRVTFKPQAIVPDVDFRGDTGELIEAITPD